jgi:hypothetical protein
MSSSVTPTKDEAAAAAPAPPADNREALLTDATGFWENIWRTVSIAASVCKGRGGDGDGFARTNLRRRPLFPPTHPHTHTHTHPRAQEEVPKFDLQSPSPCLLKLIADGMVPPGRALVPGCGRGYDVTALAAPGE